MNKSDFVAKFLLLGKKTERSARKLSEKWTEAIARDARDRGMTWHGAMYVAAFGAPPPCPVCSKPITTLIKFSQGFRTYCGLSCLGVGTEAKKRATSLRKRGVEHSGKDPKVIAQRQKTNLKRYGVETPFQCEAAKRKARKTNRARYGADNPAQSAEVQARMRSTMRERYGADNALRVPEIVARVKKTSADRRRAGRYVEADKKRVRTSRKTCRERYGVDHPMQNADVAYRALSNAFRKRNIVVEGKKFSCLGYEDRAAKYLCRRFGVDSVSQKAPVIDYRFGGKNHKYYPDFFVNGSLVVEVKSSYTAGIKHRRSKRFLQLKAKARGTRTAGFEFLLLVLDGSGNVVLKTKLPDDASCRDCRRALRKNEAGAELRA